MGIKGNAFGIRRPRIMGSVGVISMQVEQLSTNSKIEGKSVTFFWDCFLKYLLMQFITYDKLLLIGVVIIMDVQKEVKSLRESMNMNRREFCEYFDIPYRTVTDWEAGKRSMPDYVFRLMEYKARAEKMLVKDQDQEPVQRCD